MLFRKLLGTKLYTDKNAVEVWRYPWWTNFKLRLCQMIAGADSLVINVTVTKNGIKVPEGTSGLIAKCHFIGVSAR